MWFVHWVVGWLVSWLAIVRSDCWEIHAVNDGKPLNGDGKPLLLVIEQHMEHGGNLVTESCKPAVLRHHHLLSCESEGFFHVDHG